ncbi:MAG: MBL fold metallo-hydrolase [Thermotogaceae bacterium]|nr:MBL fold metallo-hydrolase [Thermotogaceae bacterium]
MGKLTIVVDNYPHDSRLKRDWGFSAYIEDRGIKLLFDLGNRSEIFMHNVKALGIDLSMIDCLVISHPDYDHVGGLDEFLVKNKKAGVFVPEGFDVGMIDKMEKSGHEVFVSKEPMDVCGRFKITGPVTPSTRPEHSLFFEGEGGVWIVAGCSHPKPWNIINKVKEIAGKTPYVYIGGYHFFRMFDDELQQAVRKVRDTEIEKVAPCHCTGEEGRRLFKEVFDKDYIEVGVGSVLEF